MARSGCYYADCAATKCSLPARDPRLARALWETSERLCGMAPGSALPRVDGGGGGGETYGGFSAEGGSRAGVDVVGAISPPPRGVSMSASTPATNGEGTGDEERTARVGEGVRAEDVDDAGSIPTSSKSGSDPSRKATSSKSGRWGLGA